MGIKEILFILFLIISISVTLFFKQKNIEVNYRINLPNIQVENGTFKKFTTHLEENGTFRKLDFFSNNNYLIYNLNMNILSKNSNLKSEKLHFNGVYNFYNAIYKTSEYTYKSSYSIHNPKTKITTSEKFTFFNKKINGKGKNMVYKNDIITANNIDYIIKGLK